MPLAAGAVWPPKTAATPTAPAPSTTSFAFSISSTIASATSSSGTTTTSSNHERISESVRSPGRLTAMPSAIVSFDGAATGSPRRSDSGYGAMLSTCTPTISTSGRADFTATAIPDASPPPPTGTTTFARSWTSSSSSNPSVPWPATTSGSSKGCTNAIPVSSARAFAAATHSSTDAPSSLTYAPCAAHPSALAIEASVGMKTSHRTPRTAAASDSAHAWFPALPAVTPRAQPSPSAASLLSAPRILNEPVRWRFSAFTTVGAPRRSVSVTDGRTGVRFATSATAARARSTSAAVTSCW